LLSVVTILVGLHTNSTDYIFVALLTVTMCMTKMHYGDRVMDVYNRSAFAGVV